MMDFGQRVARVKDRLTFAEVLELLGLESDGDGAYDCPKCDGARSLRASKSHTRGGFCKACDQKFDVFRLVVVTLGLSAHEALAELEALAAKKSGQEARGASADLFLEG